MFSAFLNRHRALLLVLASALLMQIYLWGVLRQAFVVNQDSGKTDQGAYIAITRSMAAQDQHFVTVRVRMPFYMMLASTLMDDKLSDEQIFVLGKIFNICISVLIIAVMLLLFYRTIHPVYGVLLGLLAGFTLVGYRAGYFQCELLYQFFFLLFFAMAFEFFRRPTFLLAAAMGVVGALGHLTKASLLLGVYLVVACATAVLVWKLLPLPWARDRAPWGARWPRALREWSMVFVMFAAFFATGAPYFIKSKQMHGGFFFNYNTNHNMWYDSWEEVKAKTPGVPVSQLRTMKDYLAEKTPQQIIERMGRGFEAYRKAFFDKYFLGTPLLILFGGAVALWLAGAGGRRWAVAARFASAEHFMSVVMLGVFSLAYAFHADVLPQARFFITLALPMFYWVGKCAADVLRAGDGSCGEGDCATPITKWAWPFMIALCAALLLFELKYRWLKLAGTAYFGH